MYHQRLMFFERRKTMNDHSNGTAVLDEPANGFNFEVGDVTGSHRLLARDVQRELPASTVAKALAARMSLPATVPWTLRNDATSEFLDEAKPIGEQIEAGAKVTLTPKTHLGGD
jgi:hypothetical protein